MSRFSPAVFLEVMALLFIASAAHAESEWRSLFNGRDLDEWTTVLEKSEPGKDPQGYVQVRDGMIHMYPDTDPAATVPFGVIVHKDTFSRFHLTFEYQWNGKKFAPRKNDIRDAGVLYHATNTGKVWPDSVEYRIQEGDTGDIVFIKTGGLTWKHPLPQTAPKGQGEPGMLPEEGGLIGNYQRKGFAYIGRYPELDRLEGWNRVDLIVQADESAEHRVNGKVRARLSNLVADDGTPLKAGKIALQLEGAELLYRDVKIRELPEPVQVHRTVVSLSAVKGEISQSANLTIFNPGKHPLPLDISVTGKDAAAFKVKSITPTIAAGAGTTLTINFLPTRGADRYSAGLQIGDAEGGRFVVLQGIGLDAFEGKNEPSLQTIVHALGIPLDVGGAALELDTQAPVIGQSLAGGIFRAIPGKKLRVTPLARFSPVGVIPFGVVSAGGGELMEIKSLADRSTDFPDAHQCLFPPYQESNSIACQCSLSLLDDSTTTVEYDAPGEPFAFYMKGQKHTSYTDPTIKTGAAIPHTARVFPVSHFQGRKLDDAFLIGFEEAENGDYQDAVILVENVDFIGK